jgi:hypothetical protein
MHGALQELIFGVFPARKAWDFVQRCAGGSKPKTIKNGPSREAEARFQAMAGDGLWRHQPGSQLERGMARLSTSLPHRLPHK